MEKYTAPSTTGKTLDVMCFKRTKNKSSLHGQDALAMDGLPPQGTRDAGSHAVCTQQCSTYACRQPMFDLDGDILHYMNRSSLGIEPVAFCMLLSAIRAF